MKIIHGFKSFTNPLRAKKIVDAIVDTTQDAKDAVVEKVVVVVDEKTKVVAEKVTTTTISSLDALEKRARLGIFVSTGKRFFRINGIDLAGLLSLEFFTTLIPIMILASGGITGFNRKFNIGDALVRRLGLTGNTAKTLHNAFPAASDLKIFYTFFGLLSFLIWGIPLAIQVGRVFASAFESRRHTLGSEIIRGTIWFVFLLVTLGFSNFFPADASFLIRSLDFAGRFGIVFIFWVFTPVLLVRDGVAGIRLLLIFGFVGALVDVVILRVIFKYTIPILIDSWDGFGTIGIAMTIATWCTVLSTTWVLIACFGGELSKRDLRHAGSPTLNSTSKN